MTIEAEDLRGIRDEPARSVIVQGETDGLARAIINTVYGESCRSLSRRARNIVTRKGGVPVERIAASGEIRNPRSTREKAGIHPLRMDVVVWQRPSVYSPVEALSRGHKTQPIEGH